jgi:predicted hotdog family 3-hydroxylacyl-ACP dehydratase
MNGFGPLERAAIARLIPHQDAMCLLARLERWDHQHIVCSATSHRDAANPLRTTSGLLAPCLIEYAAQAMALHGALLAAAAGETAGAGFLASARDVQFGLLRVDTLPGALQIEATRSAGDVRQLLYAFRVHHQGTLIARGRAAVVLNTSLR